MLKAAIVPVTPFAQNCSVLWCDETMRGAVVDPGGDLSRVLDVVAQQAVTLEKILVTHGHLDHAGAVADLRDCLKLPAEVPHEADRFWIEKLPAHGVQFGFSPLREFTPDRWLKNGDTATVGKLRVRSDPLPRGTRRATWSFSTDRRSSPSSATCCSRARSAAPISRAAITKRSSPRSASASFHSATTSASSRGHGPMSTFGWEPKTNPYVSDLAVGSK